MRTIDHSGSLSGEFDLAPAYAAADAKIPLPPDFWPCGHAKRDGKLINLNAKPKRHRTKKHR
jgi:hypothetical protein